MITIVFTYRNRDIEIVKKCFDSLSKQNNTEFTVYCVDYGSNEDFSQALKSIIEFYPFVNLIHCPVKGQLWNKARAINIVLNQIETPYFFVGDIDMIFRFDFVEKLHELKSSEAAVYFKVGYLNQEESKKNTDFSVLKINHFSTEEATGMTLYPTKLLKQINGYDEFYHGWGAEDTDVHVRLKNSRCKVNFYNNEILMLHQWHPKSYRSSESLEPFHSRLERINHQYIQFSQNNRIEIVNNNLKWGVMTSEEDYNNLNRPSRSIFITNEKSDIDAFVSGNLFNFQKEVISFEVRKHPQFQALKNTVKKVLRKKHYEFYEFQEVNDKILEVIIQSFRNNPYNFTFDKKNSTIKFIMLFK